MDKNIIAGTVFNSLIFLIGAVLLSIGLGWETGVGITLLILFLK